LATPLGRRAAACSPPGASLARWKQAARHLPELCALRPKHWIPFAEYYPARFKSVKVPGTGGQPGNLRPEYGATRPISEGGRRPNWNAAGDDIVYDVMQGPNKISANKVAAKVGQSPSQLKAALVGAGGALAAAGISYLGETLGYSS